MVDVHHPHKLALVFVLVLLITGPPQLVSSHIISRRPPPTFCYHGGLLLTGKVDLSILFYGAIGRTQKRVIRSFIKSLNHGGGSPKPRVLSWWDIVESYQLYTSSPQRNAPNKIALKVVSQVTDRGCSLGKVITIDYIKMMVHTATAGKPPASLVVIFTDKETTVAALCNGRCYDHGVVDNQPYLIVGNPEIVCPGDCGPPFMKSGYAVPGPVYRPPNGNAAVDAIVYHFAAGLAGSITNPFKTGFSKPGRKYSLKLEASTVCEGTYGRVAYNGISGGAFNAHGLKGTKFLLPALWNPRTSSCWTPM